MRKHIVHVKDFGVIKDATVDMDKSLQVFIGAQATGKSTLSKVCYFCRKIRDYTLEFVLDQSNFLGLEGKESLFVRYLKYLTKNFVRCFGTTQHMSAFHIEYILDDEKKVDISLKKDGYIRFYFSEKDFYHEIFQLFNEIESMHADLERQQTIVLYRYIETIRNYFQKKIYNLFQDNAEIIYIPAARGLLTQIPQVFNNLSWDMLDLTMKQFIDKINETKSLMESSLDRTFDRYKIISDKKIINEENVQKANKLLKSILKAEYHNDKDDINSEKLYYDVNHWVKLMYSSSGQQEALWILILCYMHILTEKTTFMIIEEPEAHLFPTAVRDMMLLIALLINSTQSNVIVTTHNPYTLIALNVQLLSGRMERETAEKIAKDSFALAPMYRLKYQKFTAFYLENGCIHDIMDKKTHTVDIDYIDSVSDYANKKMDYLLKKWGGELDEM